MAFDEKAIWWITGKEKEEREPGFKHIIKRIYRRHPLLFLSSVSLFCGFHFAFALLKCQVFCWKSYALAFWEPLSLTHIMTIK